MVNIDAKVKDSNGNICRVEGVYDDEILVSYGSSHAEDSDFLKHGTYTVIEDIREELEQQKQRADELEEKIDKNKRLHDAAIKSAGILFSDEKQRADELESLLYTYRENAKSIPAIIEQMQVSNKRANELQELIERFLYANKEHDIYAIKTEQELLEEYEKIK